MNSKNKPTRIAVHKDNNGNNIIIDHYTTYANIKLKLHAENRSRNIGTLDFSTRVLIVKRIRDKHLFRKMNAYGLNYYLLSEAKLFDHVRLRDEQNDWLIPRTFILDNGKFLNFSNHGGFELQIFIPIDIIMDFQQIPRL